MVADIVFMTEADIPQVLALIKEHAAYEGHPNGVDVTEERMLEDGVGPRAIFQCYVAKEGDRCVGAALFFPRYSSWHGRGVFLEDLIVSAAYRGKGIGKALFQKVAAWAANWGATQMEWQVQDVNSDARKFYEKLGAYAEPHWLSYELDTPELSAYKTTQNQQQ